jgi:hypothetical protein
MGAGELTLGQRIQREKARRVALRNRQLRNEARDDPAIKPIETYYAGCRFRSRLEARHAVLFDHLDIPWEYEPQGYLIGEGRRPYLPDFHLPEQRAWVEVKGHEAALDLDLLVAAAEPVTGLPLSLDPEDNDWPLVAIRLLIFGSIPAEQLFSWSLAVVSGNEVAFQAVMPICKGWDSSRWGHGHAYAPVTTPKRLPPGGGPLDPAACPSLLASWGSGFGCPEVAAAYRAARSARFEHGESG